METGLLKILATAGEQAPVVAALLIMGWQMAKHLTRVETKLDKIGEELRLLDKAVKSDEELETIVDNKILKHTLSCKRGQDG